jgi:hypothetical protein
VETARSDGVGPGYCGRGVWSVLKALGKGQGLQSANGHDWEEVLSSAGWVPYSCGVPDKAPLGSVLVYLSDIKRFGRNLVGTAGGRWGHVELVASSQGRRYYVSDAPRLRPGGTVPLNFTRRAWLPPGAVRLESAPLPRRALDPALFKAGASRLLEARLGDLSAVFVD